MESNGNFNGTYQDSTQVHTILDSLNKQRSTSKLCDVILRISDDQIYAHSNILSAASPYFDLLFSEQDLPRAFSQKSPQIIEIQIDGPNDPGYIKAVHKVVDFMYSSRIQIEESLLMHVIEIARIMQMNNIIDYCNMFMKGCPGTLKHDVDTQTDTYVNDEDKIDQTKKGLSTGRKRGRPRKIRTDDLSNSCNENMSENLHNSDNSSIQKDKSSTDFDCISQEEHSSSVASFRSKRGRMIKRKTYSDYMVSFVKEEPLSDSEQTSDKEMTDSNIVNNTQPDNVSNSKPVDNDTVTSEIQPVDTDLQDACENSEKTLTDSSDLVEPKPELVNNDKKCTYCGWVFDYDNFTDKDFQEHVNSHNGSNKTCCTFCMKNFNSRARLHLHMPKHFKTRPYTCEICHASFKWRHGLKSHMIVHKSSKDYLCDICGFATAHKSQLTAHRTLHTGETFKCQHGNCDYQSTKKCNVKFHMLTHTKEKPHKCELCGQSFSLKKNMRRHKLLHAADRPLKCEKCNFSTTRFDKLKEHYLKLHNIGEKPKKKILEYLRYRKPQEIENIEYVPEHEVETSVLNIGDGMETIELEVAEEDNGTTTTQIVNVTSSTGESIPIAITQNGSEITYQITTQEIPIQIIPEVTTE